MKQQKYAQCQLQRGTSHTTGWISEEHAVLGKVLELEIDGAWEAGWKVTGCGEVRLPVAYLRERERDYLHTRSASDI